MRFTLMTSLAAGVDDPLGLSAQVFATRNVFELPLQQPNTSQRATALSSSLPQASFGILLPIQTLRAEGNTFEQTDASPYLKYAFEAYREQQIGIYAGLLKVAKNNVFTSLAAGIKANVGTGEQIEIRGNIFDDCERGEWLLPYYYAGSSGSSADPVVFTSCNTFIRDKVRGGDAYGIRVDNNPGNTGASPGLTFDDIYNLNGIRTGNKSLLKDWFEDQGYGSTNGGYWSIRNMTSIQVNYLTFTGYNVLHGSWTAGPVAFFPGGYVDTSPTPVAGLEPCTYDGFIRGIQMRGTTTTSTPMPVPMSSFANLAQNVPNPCTGATTIHYKTTDSSNSIGLLIQRGTDGRKVGQVALRVQDTEFTLDLGTYAPGVYFYTLLVNGIPSGTRRMLVQ